MGAGTAIDVDKREDTSKEISAEERVNQQLGNRHRQITLICEQLSGSTQEFNPKESYNCIIQYIDEYDRWLYSDISGYLFACNEKDSGTFISNLDSLQVYAHKFLESASTKEKKNIERVVIAIDKLWDHANLAQKQNLSLHDSDADFAARFRTNLIPFEAKFSHEMTSQFISLIAIFTALSFILFGGISSLDNIFSSATGIPILELMIVGCIWSLCISNLIFVFMFFISKLTHISIKSSDHSNASLGEKYPLFVWCNFVQTLILAISCWLYYIDYSNSGGWLLAFSQNNAGCSFAIGLISISVVFAVIAFILLKKKK